MSDTGSVTLVTGATGGIGKAIVSELVRGGHHVIATDLREPAAKDRVPGAQYVASNLLDDAGIERLISAVPGGLLTGLVNAAGVAFFDTDGSVFDIAEPVWAQTIGVNLDGLRKVTKAALPLLRAGNQASIVNIASTAGLRGMDDPLDAYQVSKAAVVSLSQSIALQLGPEGIRCNTVCPGAILTPMISSLYDESPERRQDMERRTPLRRLGLPEDVASAVSFLLSDNASFVTGTNLVVDGGWTAQIK
ncbi:SDR family oxidoreductase [Arthrobacter sp. UCD-GKA]|uniref:SDR family NAD(P)-dependent oxidoreductase n=1 Tax=Arthrobacter sp. UCD-GKA TaxID=1913576 RepID=UPI0009F4E541|nr:SDR family oxidoreductase [Arthrobacter sp. UCD-GKA]